LTAVLVCTGKAFGISGIAAGCQDQIAVKPFTQARQQIGVKDVVVQTGYHDAFNHRADVLDHVELGGRHGDAAVAAVRQGRGRSVGLQNKQARAIAVVNRSTVFIEVVEQLLLDFELVAQRPELGYGPALGPIDLGNGKHRLMIDEVGHQLGR
jgi:hypothetical protein